MKFLTGIDPTKAEQQVVEAQSESIKATDGKAVKSKNLIMVAEDFSLDQIQRMRERPDAAREAVTALKEVFLASFKDLVASRIDHTHPRREKYKLILKQLPDLDPEALDTPDLLTNLGVWKSEP